MNRASGTHQIMLARGAARATMPTVRRLRRLLSHEGGVAAVEGDIASVAEVFALQGDARMRELERAYLR